VASGHYWGREAQNTTALSNRKKNTCHPGLRSAPKGMSCDIKLNKTRQKKSGGPYTKKISLRDWPEEDITRNRKIFPARDGKEEDTHKAKTN